MHLCCIPPGIQTWYPIEKNAIFTPKMKEFIAMPAVCCSAVMKNRSSASLQRQTLGLEECPQPETEILEELSTRLPNINKRLTSISE